SFFYSLLWLIGSFFPVTVIAQNAEDKYLISQIIFEGNRRTQDSTLLREMSIKIGDSLSLNEITRNLKASKDRLTNLGLFTDVSGNMYFDEENPDHVRIFITIKEG